MRDADGGFRYTVLFTVEIGTTARRRPYRQEARAASTAATRHGIVEAARALHRTVGPAATSILAVAAAADVQRLTVYRHFPTPETLDAACADREAVLHPPPDPAAFQAVDPVDRLLDALATFDRYYAEVDALLENLLRTLRGIRRRRSASAPTRPSSMPPSTVSRPAGRSILRAPRSSRPRSGTP